MRARAIAAQARFFKRALHVVEAVHAGVWVGVLRSATLTEVTRCFYSDNALYADAGFNAQGLFSWETQVVERYFPAQGGVLLAACGGGREAFALAQLGHAVVAFDPEPRYLAAARADARCNLAGAPVFCHAAPGHVPDALGHSDAGIIGWGAYTHIPDREARVRFLGALGEHLGDGAPLLLSFWAYAAGDRQLRLAWSVAKWVARLSLNSRHPEPGDWMREFFVHHFTREQVESELRDAGFTMVYFQSEPYGHAVALRHSTIARTS